MTPIRRRDLLAAGPGALLASTDGVSQPRPTASRAKAVAQVDVRRDFGAVGDGVADDWAAIEAAGAHLERLGGGRIYFPTGRYRLPDQGKNITVRSNIEYFGDGHSSVILGSNAAFVSPQGAAFGRSAYHLYEYFSAETIKSGDQFIDLRDSRDAVRFSVGDIVLNLAEARDRN